MHWSGLNRDGLSVCIWQYSACIVQGNFREQWMNFIVFLGRNLRVNDRKNKVMVFERREIEVCNYRISYMMSVRMKEVRIKVPEDSYWNKHGEMEEEISEKVIKGSLKKKKKNHMILFIITSFHITMNFYLCRERQMYSQNIQKKFYEVLLFHQ